MTLFDESPDIRLPECQGTADLAYEQVEAERARQVAENPDLMELTFRAWEPRKWLKRPGRTCHYPQGVIPIHAMPPPKRRPAEDAAAHARRHWGRIRRLVKSVERVGAHQIPPILVDQSQLITGTHRWIANELLERRGKTTARIQVVELVAYPPIVQFVIRLLFNAEEHTKTQPAFHLLTGLPLTKGELVIKEWIAPAVWACCDSRGQLRNGETLNE